MKVAHFSFDDSTVGAMRAAYELHDCMRKRGVDSTLFVRNKTGNDDSVIELGYNDDNYERVLRTINLLCFQYNRAPESMWCNLDEIGIFWTQELESLLQKYDVFHLHWVAGFLSIDNIVRMLKMGKRVVWTMHDFHPFTAVCHSPLTCTAFKSECKDCKQLKVSQNTAVQLEWQRKKAMQQFEICIITASEWLKQEVKESVIFGNKRCEKIPIGINENIFRIKDKLNSKEKFGFLPDDKIILIGAHNVAAKLKGYVELNTIIENMISDGFCRFLLEQGKLKLVAFGQGIDQLSIKHVPVSQMGFISDRETLCDLYNAADVFLFLSKQETFGMTAAEVMFCGTPVVAYDICAMHEVICDGVNGYRVESGNLQGMAQGILNLLKKEDFDREACREHMMNEYTLEIEADNITNLYNELLKQNGYLKYEEKQEMESRQAEELIRKYFVEIVQKRVINQGKNFEVSAIFDKYNPVFMQPSRKVKKLQEQGKISRDTSIVIFGAGNIGKQMCNVLEKLDMDLLEFWDNDENKWGGKLEGYYITAPQPYENGWRSRILIASFAYTDMEMQLCQLGYIPERDFF